MTEYTYFDFFFKIKNLIVLASDFVGSRGEHVSVCLWPPGLRWLSPSATPSAKGKGKG